MTSTDLNGEPILFISLLVVRNLVALIETPDQMLCKSKMQAYHKLRDFLNKVDADADADADED